MWQRPALVMALSGSLNRLNSGGMSWPRTAEAAQRPFALQQQQHERRFALLARAAHRPGPHTPWAAEAPHVAAAPLLTCPAHTW